MAATLPNGCWARVAPAAASASRCASEPIQGASWTNSSKFIRMDGRASLGLSGPFRSNSRLVKPGRAAQRAAKCGMNSSVFLLIGCDPHLCGPHFLPVSVLHAVEPLQLGDFCLRKSDAFGHFAKGRPVLGARRRGGIGLGFRFSLCHCPYLEIPPTGRSRPDGEKFRGAGGLAGTWLRFPLSKIGDPKPRGGWCDRRWFRVQAPLVASPVETGTGWAARFG